MNRNALIRAIALRDRTANELAIDFNLDVQTLKDFVELNRPAIQAERDRLDNPPPDTGEPTPEQLSDLWITNKFERLKRLQEVAEEAYQNIVGGMYDSPAEQATVIREFRSYLMLAANELGQLLHRGAGDAGEGDSLKIEIAGVDMESLR